MRAQRILRPSKQFRFLQILVSNEDKTILVMCVSQKEILCRRTDLNNFQPTTAFKIFIAFPTVLIIFIFGNYFQTFDNQDLCVFEVCFILLFQKRKFKQFLV